MNTYSAISTAALAAFLLVGSSLHAQEAVAPATAATAAGVEENTAPVVAQPAVAPSPNSKVRIVRLSEVKGEVQLDRETGKGFEGAMANLPVVEGARLKTGTGVAEVEFEDNSTVRVAPDSVIKFTQLELLPSGAKASGIEVLKGEVYVNLMNTKGNQFTVAFGKEKVNLPPDSHIRLQLTQDQAEVAVLHGEAIAESATGNTSVTKNKTMTFNLAAPGEPNIAKSVTEQPLDSWDHEAVQYHKSYANASSFGNSPYSYGINDMNYYGSFSSGCGGSFWRPYFAGANFDPYGSGSWAYYQNAGYSWVSPYPWGWTPYHYGSWSFCQGLGWGWQPGGAWQGLANNSFSTAPTRPHPPLHPPTGLQPTTVAVGLRSVPASSLGKGDTFVFRNGSAGLGVPRSGLGRLNSFSGKAERGATGVSSTHVYTGSFGGQSQSSSRLGGVSAHNSTSSREGFSNARNSSTSNSSMSRGSGGGMSGGMSSGSMSGGSHASSGSGGGRH